LGLEGRTLIEGAKIRAEISQLGRLDAAANIFRNRYNAFPGDMSYFPHISPTFSLNIFRVKQVDLSRRLRRRWTD
jgi:hypothetical protein